LLACNFKPIEVSIPVFQSDEVLTKHFRIRQYSAIDGAKIMAMLPVSVYDFLKDSTPLKLSTDIDNILLNVFKYIDAYIPETNRTVLLTTLEDINQYTFTVDVLLKLVSESLKENFAPLLKGGALDNIRSAVKSTAQESVQTLIQWLQQSLNQATQAIMTSK